MHRSRHVIPHLPVLPITGFEVPHQPRCPCPLLTTVVIGGLGVVFEDDVEYGAFGVLDAGADFGWGLVR